MITHKYIVKDEHTLGYRIAGMPGWMGILHKSVIRSGDSYGHMSGPIPFTESEVRPATRKDFEEYRVGLPPELKHLWGVAP